MPGRGRGWIPPELDVLAKAYTITSNDPILGVAQKTNTFWEKVKQHFDILSPDDHEPGRYKDRPLGSIKSYWYDVLHPEVNKFQEKLTKVLAAKLTGNLSDDQKINIAVALHLGEIKMPSYDYRDFAAREKWKCFSAWYDVLRKHPKWARDMNVNTVATQLGVVAAAGAGAAAGAVADARPTNGATNGTTASVPGSITLLGTSVSSNGSVPEDASVASVAVADPLSLSSRKRGEYPGRAKAKAALKKEKKDEKKIEYMNQKQEIMGNWMEEVKQQTAAAKQQAASSGRLESILETQVRLEKKKQKIQQAKMGIKMAKSLGDQSLYDLSMKKLKKYFFMDSDSEQEDLFSPEKDEEGEKEQV